MAKDKKKRENLSRRGPAPADHPIYKTGFMTLQPVRGKQPQTTSEDSPRKAPPDKS